MNRIQQMLTGWFWSVLKEQGKYDQIEVLEMNPDTSTFKLKIGQDINQTVEVTFMIKT